MGLVFRVYTRTSVGLMSYEFSLQGAPPGSGPLRDNEEGGGKREEGGTAHTPHKRKKSAQAEVAVENVAAAAAEQQQQNVHNKTAKSEEECRKDTRAALTRQKLLQTRGSEGI
jgi:hypothetical protein